MEELTRLPVDHQVLQMAVTNAQQVGCNAVARTRINVSIQDFTILLFIDGRTIPSSVLLTEESLNRFIIFLFDILDGHGVRHELQQAIVSSESNAIVDRELGIQTSVFQNSVHDVE